MRQLQLNDQDYTLIDARKKRPTVFKNTIILKGVDDDNFFNISGTDISVIPFGNSNFAILLPSKYNGGDDAFIFSFHNNLSTARKRYKTIKKQFKGAILIDKFGKQLS